jgi:hypothetical protein
VPTEVTLRFGAPTQVCRASQHVSVHAPLHLESADGQVAFDRSVTLAFAGPGSGFLDWGSAWVAPRDLETASGVRGVDLGASEYGTVSLHAGIDYTDDVLEGTLSIDRWERFTERAADHPALHFCAGEGCDFFWCGLSSDESEACTD